MKPTDTQRHDNIAKPKLELIYLPIDALIPDPNNARVHPKRQIEKLAAGIREFGFSNPILIDERNQLIAGHGRLLAAPRAGLDQVPCLRIVGLSEASRKALAIADNKLGDLSWFDTGLLSATLAQLEGLDFTIELTGFDTAELDILLEQPVIGAEGAVDPADVIEPVDLDVAAVTRLGNLWRLGDHLLLCGDALKPDSFERLLGGKLADLVFTDPPYNVPINGHVSGLGKHKHREFAMASGEMSREQFTEFLTTSLGLMARHARDGSIHFVCMDHRHMGELLAAGGKAYDEFKNLCVWDKGSGGMGSLYRSQHELVFVFKRGKGPHINNIQLGRYGRNRTNVWSYPGLSSFGRGRDEALASHSTVKPVSLVADAIRDCSKRGDLVLDAFAGSGTTIIAAERARRRAAAIELDPIYVDVAIRRWEKLTGKAATLDGDGRSFAEISAARQDQRPNELAPEDVLPFVDIVY